MLYLNCEQTRRCKIVSALLFAAFAICMGSLEASAEIHVGVAAVDISPPDGSPMAGYYSARGCTGIHDPLHATAMVIERDGQRAVVVGLDLITTTKELVDDVRRAVTSSTGIPSDAIMISASHTHTGPSIRTTGRDAEAMQNGSDEVREYLANLPKMIASAVETAANQ
jgi:neutral ceramidase